jgi:hypothetical protein
MRAAQRIFSARNKMAAFGSKAAKLMMLGKQYTAAEYEADAIRAEAARLMADEDALEAAKAEASNTFLYEAIVGDLRRELDSTKALLMQHTSARELALKEDVEMLRAEKRALEARLHWESQYGIFLPGAFLLANDGECECSREFRLYGGFSVSEGGGGAAAADHTRGRACDARSCSCPGTVCTLGPRAGRKSRTGRRDGSGRFVRTCSCGHDY